MTWRVALFVALGAAIGALARWGVGLWLPKVGGLPAGTLAVNLAGSFVLGAMAGWGPDVRVTPEVRGALATGFCGALTTMSTFAVETLDQPPAKAGLHVLLHVGGSLGAAALGAWVARSLRS